MFKWYQKAKKCYVYLADVSFDGNRRENLLLVALFQRSRWFTRGWTLQELMAPALVEFYFAEWVLVGNNTTPIQHIQGTTRIPLPELKK